ncbi:MULTISPECIES: site-specific integrase [unclassified Rhodococcus (in: high G+C Gram-positive bacteria)]|uniref:site-specific integrase n=1 Tax=unclassified Rhodococcus (in: high G+C Gram-positive bacteria) TaxID=192944 RepID=UPI00163AEC50|nr:MULTISPECIES: site-specific integrase [unclassified Rhodococcus (in: high G+C Gram-positive bacteria)]MBC2637838.1 tyrosine-type recombinase/integrase [Rhodococcus sp. 3A]MBC2897415.1 tyrosine-type recombinase/integrase [Rhodococcus sp. 4CII]
MEPTMSVLVDGVLTAARGAGLTEASLKYQRSCCATVARYCTDHAIDEYNEQVRDRFLAEQDTRLQRRNIGPVFRSSLEKTANMLLEFKMEGKVVWRRRRPMPTQLPPRFETALRLFDESLSGTLAVGSVELALGEIRQLLTHLHDRGHDSFHGVGLGDVREFLMAIAPNHQSGMGNTVWAVKRFFSFLNDFELSDLPVHAMLSQVSPRRIRILPRFTQDEVTRLLAVIDTATAVGNRDYAMVRLAVSTGLRCGDITDLRLESIDWRRDEIRIVQRKTAATLALPLTVEAGNAVADYILNARPASDSPEVFLRAHAPHVKLTGPTGALIMKRHLAAAGIPHKAGDGKTFHALRRTLGTRLIETGAELPMAAQILGHARIDSSKRYIALDTDSLRECCLPLTGFECRAEALQ